MVMSDLVVFFDVDTQADFMNPTGSLYVKGAETIVPNLKKLMDFARANNIPVLSSADAHAPDDPSFSEWPPHCVVGTPGQFRIPETSFPSAFPQAALEIENLDLVWHENMTSAATNNAEILIFILIN